MKNILLLILTTSPCAFAQNAVTVTHYRTGGPAGVTAAAGVVVAAGPPVEGAPYAATVTSKSTQTLEDGSLIVQSNTGSVARDSEGRTREDAPMPAVDDSSMRTPHLVFVQDPVAHVSYVLNLTNKTAEKAPLPSGAGVNTRLVVRSRTALGEETGDALFVGAPEGQVAVMTSGLLAGIQNVRSEDLGSKTIEGLMVNGVRTTNTIPAGEIGNAKAIQVISEVWTSPELKAVVYSKLSDPRTGEHIFELTNILRGEPDASLFVVPSDFRLVDGPVPASVDSE